MLEPRDLVRAGAAGGQCTVRVGHGAEAIDAGPALTGGFGGHPPEDPGRFYNTAAVTGQDGDRTAAESATCSTQVVIARAHRRGGGCVDPTPEVSAYQRRTD